jgi:sulfur relay (sulfurtransferase) DsrC/TusE family protein
MNINWTPQSAEEAAKREGISLGEKHWCVITNSRELIARRGHVPSLREVGAMCGVSVEEINTLFPGAAAEVIARLAGAPEIERNAR